PELDVSRLQPEPEAPRLPTCDIDYSDFSSSLPAPVEKPYWEWEKSSPGDDLDFTNRYRFYDNRQGFAAGRGIKNDSEGSLWHIDGGVGRWSDQTFTTYNGIRLQGGVIHLTGEHNDGGFLNFDVGAYATNSTATLSVELNVIDYAHTWGSNRESLRLGVAVSPGAAVRLHYGDADRDGIHELGGGVDVGFIEVDVKSQTLGEAAFAAEGPYNGMYLFLHNTMPPVPY